MDEIMIRNFDGENIYTFVWNNRPCWIAVDISKVLGYQNKSASIKDYIRKEKFTEGIEYEILDGDKLKLFKEIFNLHMEHIKYSPKLIILYEQGLYGFLSTSTRPKGIEFRIWLRNDVLPTMREKGYYIVDDLRAGEIIEDLMSKVSEPTTVKNSNFDMDKFQRIKIAYDSAKMFKELLDNITMDSTYKFLLLKEIFNQSGIELPKYIEEERF